MIWQKISAGTLAFWVWIQHAAALDPANATLAVDIGPKLTVKDIVTNVSTVMTGSITAIGLAAFIWGAFQWTTAGGQDDKKSDGKNYMIGGVLGVAVVYMAKGLMNLIMYFIYGA